MSDPSASPGTHQGLLRGNRRRPIRFVVVGDEARASALGFRLESMGHDAEFFVRGRDALERAAPDVHAFVVDDSLPDVAPAALAESLRLNPVLAATWIFNVSRYHRPHREVSEGTGVFDRILVDPASSGDLERIVALASYPRDHAGN